METSNIIALFLGGIGFIISIVGFVVTPVINLRSKRLEKRLEYRFQLFQRILELWELTHKTSALDKSSEPLIFEINKLIQLYGYSSEIKLFREVIDSYNQYGREQTDSKRRALVLKFNSFFESSFNTYRGN